MAPDSTCRNFSNSGILITLHGSLREQRTLGDTTTGFPAKWRLKNERRSSILMTRHYPDLDSASDWLNQISHAARPFSSSIQIWVVTRHQYGISTLVFRTSFGGRKLVLALPNVGCFLRLLTPAIWVFGSEINIIITNTVMQLYVAGSIFQYIVTVAYCYCSCCCCYYFCSFFFKYLYSFVTIMFKMFQ